MYVVQNPCGGAARSSGTWLPLERLLHDFKPQHGITGSMCLLLRTAHFSSDGALRERSAKPTVASQARIFQGVDNALLEKQEAARIATGLTWWKDAGFQPTFFKS